MSEVLSNPAVSPNYSERQTQNRWNRLLTSKLGKILMIGALLGGPAVADLALDAAPAAAAEPGCYGDYCSGKYPDEMGCDKDARTLGYTELSNTADAASVNVGPIGGSMGGGDSSSMGVVELRWSDKCGTAWARLHTSRNSNITYLGVEKDDGYRQQVSTNARWIGTKDGNWFTPMVYGRGDSEFRAYVFSQEWYDVTPDNAGTYWMNAKEAQDM